MTQPIAEAAFSLDGVPGKRRVAVYREPGLAYPVVPPFHPETAYPEYPFGPMATGSPNSVYAAVRELLRLAGLDRARYGSPQWNPLGDLVRVGGAVLIKPNWVRHYHLQGGDIFSIITHPAVLRVLADYAFKAVGPEGRVWIMDAPLADTDFEALRRICHLDKMERSLRTLGMPVTIADMRSLVTVTDHGVVTRRSTCSTWAAEGVEFDLGRDSHLAELGATLRNVFGSDYDRRITASYHSMDGCARNAYRIARRVLEADLVISVPKLKTHKKTGVTLNIKNMIGANTDKNYIPHYRVGPPAEGGDEFPDTSQTWLRIRRWFVRQAVDGLLGRSGRMGEAAVHLFMMTWLPLARHRAAETGDKRLDPVDVFYRTVQGDWRRTGNWWGNDTCWRGALDIARIVIYGRLDGRLADAPQRRFFSVIDGIVGGEGDGPLAPTPRNDGVLVAGFDPLTVDRVAAQLMGFDPDRLPDLRAGMRLAAYPLAHVDAPVSIHSNALDWNGEIAADSHLAFRPHPGWAEVLQGRA